MPANKPACLLIHLQLALPADMTVTGPGKWLACLLPILTHSLTRSLSQYGNRSTTRPALPVVFHWASPTTGLQLGQPYQWPTTWPALPVAYHLAGPISRSITGNASVLPPVLPANRPASLLLCLPIGLPACLPISLLACSYTCK